MLTTRPTTVAVLVALGACAACASAPPAATSAPTTGQSTPADSTASAAGRRAAGALAAFVGRPLVIAPSQRLRVVAGAPAWAPTPDRARAYLGTLDDEIAGALADRGVAPGGVMPAQVARSARRNPTFASDPYALAVDAFLPTARPAAPDAEVADPLRSQLRAITALTEARYLLVPVEVRFERAAGVGGGADSGDGRALLRLALFDTRGARVAWTGEVASDAASSLSPAVAASLADRIAGLAAPPPP